MLAESLLMAKSRLISLQTLKLYITLFKTEVVRLTMHRNNTYPKQTAENYS